MPRTEEAYRQFVADSFRTMNLRMDALGSEVKSLGGRMETVEGRLSDGDKIMGQLGTELAANTETTKRVETTVNNVDESTKEIVEMFRSVKAGFKFLGWIATGVEWAIKKIGFLVVFAAACYGTVIAAIDLIRKP